MAKQTDPIEIVEGLHTFSFDPFEWSHLLKFDGKENIDYKNIRDSVPGTKAVDIIGVRKDSELVFIEVKDFRKDRKSLDDRIDKGTLKEELVQKVRDSIACITASARVSTNSVDLWRRYLQLLQNNDIKVRYIVYLESVRPIDARRIKKSGPIPHPLGKTFTFSFRKWLTTHVNVITSAQDTEAFSIAVKVDSAVHE